MHIPVLLNEVLRYLSPKPNENLIDCTYGFGGHSRELLKRIAPNGRILGIERERQVAQMAGESDSRLILVQGNFADLKNIAKAHGFRPRGILFDLGLSSWQIEESGRGFSFKKDEPLLMNFSGSDLTAEEVVNEWSEKELVHILQDYGEERYARPIIKAICEARQQKPIKTTGRLVEAIKNGISRRYQHGRIHFATKTFQALRIAVNDELNNLKKALPQAVEVLEPNGRLAVIAFHSLEDRIVKRFFREEARKGRLKILTKKPVRPDREEIKRNPRSRSAKLRAAVKEHVF